MKRAKECDGLHQDRHASDLCPVCNGEGRVERACHACQGTGTTLPRPERRMCSYCGVEYLTIHPRQQLCPECDKHPERHETEVPHVP